MARPGLIAASAAAAAAALFGGALFALLIAAEVERLDASLPPPVRLADVETSAVVLDRKGRLLRPFAIGDGRWRLPVKPADVDRRFLAMLTGYEDRRFYRHRGVDYRALVRAGLQLLAHGRIVSGGSTLTMQVARLIDGRSTRSLEGKLRQILLARRLERRFSKTQILKLYLTLAPYGGNLEGIRAATLAYFGKEPARLTPAEAALLVAIPQAPEARRPDRFPKAARQARDRVLKRLAAAGVLHREQAAAAMRERMPATRRPFPLIAAHVSERAVRSARRVRLHELTIDRALQQSLEKLMAERVRTMAPGLSGAVLVADHRTGEVLASVGSPGYLNRRREGFNDMTRAVRSPGSALKPVIYGLAFEAGMAHPETLIEDRPRAFSGYVPANFDGGFRGTVTVREALTLSLNVPAVAVLDAVGPARLLARLRRAGAEPVLPDDTPAGLAIALGGIGVSLHDLVSVYGAIGHGGEPLRLSVRTAASRLSTHAPAMPVLEAAAAWQVADILAGTPAPANGSPGRIAFKTGTSYGYRDAWAVGFDSRVVAGVWVGRADGASVPGLSGHEAAAPLLMEVFDRIGSEGAAVGSPPAGVLQAATAELPVHLRRFRRGNGGASSRRNGPEIAFPPNGVRVDLALADGDGRQKLAMKVRNGTPPFTWVVNGRPLARSRFARAAGWAPDGPGFVTISVIDGAGRSDRVRAFVE